MPALRILALVLLATALLNAQTPPPPRAGGPPAPPTAASVETANKILAETRKARGGDKQASVKSFVATGRTKRVSGENLVPVEFEIDVELPDKYVRKDEIPAQETAPSSSGFN